MSHQRSLTSFPKRTCGGEKRLICRAGGLPGFPLFYLTRVSGADPTRGRCLPVGSDKPKPQAPCPRCAHVRPTLNAIASDLSCPRYRDTAVDSARHIPQEVEDVEWQCCWLDKRPRYRIESASSSRSHVSPKALLESKPTQAPGSSWEPPHLGVSLFSYLLSSILALAARRSDFPQICIAP
ncbi:hypothetical protein VTK73DRAFT_178 [Phialemonium thermophilum]|uniref:Uncharacterized protein n=1 Tax=Phialemonium thermophilum TaxID=223376 RepID=A0ABR3VWH0_9PEZI